MLPAEQIAWLEAWLTQQEYYRLFAFLNHDHEASTIVYPGDLQMRVAIRSQEMRDLETKLRHNRSDCQERMNAWEDSLKDDQPEWSVVRCVNAGDNRERFYYYEGGSIRAASNGPKTWKEKTGPEQDRRSLDIFKFRPGPYPRLQTSDAPHGDFSCVRRLRSNPPLQALGSLNEPQFVECAQARARTTLAEGGQTDAERIPFAFRRALARLPTEFEQK